MFSASSLLVVVLRFLRRRCVLEIQRGRQLTGSSNMSETMTHITKISRPNLRHSTTANSQEVYLSDSNNDRRPTIGNVGRNRKLCEVQLKFQQETWGLTFKTMYMWKIVLTDQYNIDTARKTRHNYISGTLTSKFQRQISDFRRRRVR